LKSGIAAGYDIDAMKVQRILVTFGCWLFGCIVAQARIGETEKQCEERYGKPVRVMKDKSSLAYAKAPMLLLLHFTDGRCDEISYVRADESTPEIRTELSETERDFLQRANGGSRKWKKSSASSDTTICFETSDGELGSLYSIASRTLLITTHEAYKRFYDQAKAQEKNDLKGF
jgi:hypothetical protein